MWRHSIARSGIPPVRCKHLRDISYTRRAIADFVPNFVATATVVGGCRICVASFNSPTPKTPARRKHLRDISYTTPVIANFVLNFAAMAMGDDGGRIYVATFNSRSRKPPVRRKHLRYILYKPSYSRFCPKFRCHGNGGWSW